MWLLATHMDAPLNSWKGWNEIKKIFPSYNFHSLKVIRDDVELAAFILLLKHSAIIYFPIHFVQKLIHSIHENEIELKAIKRKHGPYVHAKKTWVASVTVTVTHEIFTKVCKSYKHVTLNKLNLIKMCPILEKSCFFLHVTRNGSYLRILLRW